MATDEHAAPLSAAEIDTLRGAILRLVRSESAMFVGGDTARRLLATLDAYRAVVAAVAGLLEPRTDARRTWECSHCGRYLIVGEHDPDCVVLQACALLSGTEG